MNTLLIVVGIIVLAAGLARQARARSTYNAFRRSGFGTVQERAQWSPMRWPQGRAAWRDELGLWFKIAVYSALFGAIFTLVVTH